MVYCLLCAAVVIILLCVKIYLLKKSAREISAQFADRLKSDTNNTIYVSSGDKDIRGLAESIDSQLSLLRREKLSCIRGNRKLKNAVTNISHDLRTPLTAIRGYLDLAEKTDDPQKLRRYFSVISQRTDAMQQLTEELFSYSVIISKDEPEDTEEIYVNQLLAECISSYYPVLTESGISPDIDLTEEKVMRTANRSELSRVFSNLLTNAAKYSSGDLEIRLTADGVITFANAAADMTPVQAAQLFDRFYTVETARSSTGLGLSIARALAERAGGSLSAELTDGRLIITLKI
ncbi:sensor histidine kinase [Ruminococcus flavefaciens]|uniref:sensor histidine kinase n=1 Tax=Ruminococcus flavefaciens TaxID=1265 RepID=UPI00048FFDEF|nr:HAMP domain-containing sensor histidine kinase [Ruminococcus flavefaciens]